MKDEELKESVERLKRAADKAAEQYNNKSYDFKDVIKDVLGFVFVTAIGFGWTLIMLLIISFVTLGYLHFKFDIMVKVAIVAAVGTAAVYIVKMVRKYTKL